MIVIQKNKRKRKKKKKLKKRGSKPLHGEKRRRREIAKGGGSSIPPAPWLIHAGRGWGRQRWGSPATGRRAPGHPPPRSTPEPVRERQRQTRESEKEVRGGRRGSRRLHGTPATRRWTEQTEEEGGTAATGRTEPTPSQPKINPCTGSLAWIRGGFPLPPSYC